MSFVYWARLESHTDVSRQGYVGITSRLVRTRWSVHKKLAERGENPCHILQQALDKYGDAIVCVPLVQASEDYCLALEKRLRPRGGIGWNAGTGGRGTKLGQKSAPETVAKQNAHKVGKPRSPETRAKLAAALKGNKCATGSVRTPEMREAHAERVRKLWASPEYRAKVLAARGIV